MHSICKVCTFVCTMPSAQKCTQKSSPSTHIFPPRCIIGKTFRDSLSIVCTVNRIRRDLHRLQFAGSQPPGLARLQEVHLPRTGGPSDHICPTGTSLELLVFRSKNNGSKLELTLSCMIANLALGITLLLSWGAFLRQYGKGGGTASLSLRTNLGSDSL